MALKCFLQVCHNFSYMYQYSRFLRLKLNVYPHLALSSLRKIAKTHLTVLAIDCKVNNQSPAKEEFTHSGNKTCDKTNIFNKDLICS